jgi:hypothetical protein
MTKGEKLKQMTSFGLILLSVGPFLGIIHLFFVIFLQRLSGESSGFLYWGLTMESRLASNSRPSCLMSRVLGYRCAAHLIESFVFSTLQQPCWVIYSARFY